MSESLKENSPKVEKAAKAQKLVGVKGMNDILPPDSARWEWLEGQVRDLMARYAYRSVRLPIVEPTALFVRGLGEVTDIVEKEMYSFEDRLKLLRNAFAAQSQALFAINEHWGRRRFASTGQADADVGMLALAGSVHDAAHHRHLEVFHTGVTHAPHGHMGTQKIVDLLGQLLEGAAGGAAAAGASRDAGHKNAQAQ